MSADFSTRPVNQKVGKHSRRNNINKRVNDAFTFQQTRLQYKSCKKGSLFCHSSVSKENPALLKSYCALRVRLEKRKQLVTAQVEQPSRSCNLSFGSPLSKIFEKADLIGGYHRLWPLYCRNFNATFFNILINCWLDFFRSLPCPVFVTYSFQRWILHHWLVESVQLLHVWPPQGLGQTPSL